VPEPQLRMDSQVLTRFTSYVVVQCKRQTNRVLAEIVELAL
jgi:hypothetical protein